MYLDLDKHDQSKVAIKDDSGYTLTYCRGLPNYKTVCGIKVAPLRCVLPL